MMSLAEAHFDGREFNIHVKELSFLLSIYLPRYHIQEFCVTQ